MSEDTAHTAQTLTGSHPAPEPNGPRPNRARRAALAGALAAALVAAGIAIGLTVGGDDDRGAAPVSEGQADPGASGADPDPAPDSGDEEPEIDTDLLTWAPPELEDPVTVQVTQDNHYLELDDDRDYRILMPNEPLVAEGGLQIFGGHDVVIIGGEIRAPEDEDEGLDRRGLYLKEQTGTVHVEGLRMSGDLSEGINLSQYMETTVQLQNIIIEKVSGERDGHHADLLQTWAGPGRLRIDGFSGRSNYQAMFLRPNEFLEDEPPPEEFDLRRMRIAGVEQHGFMLWAPDEAESWLSVTDVQVTLNRDRGRSQTFEPEEVWEDVEVVDEFDLDMPGGDPGLNYHSPGYAGS